jgi:hypothetical protein
MTYAITHTDIKITDDITNQVAAVVTTFDEASVEVTLKDVIHNQNSWKELSAVIAFAIAQLNPMDNDFTRGKHDL